ncbi:50S ribosomal protein L30 [Candidatus Weimeria sp. HCP3S3_B5]|uniref:50S ribosomal protein L30 n=1 Tax=Candidatus Weimeria sp. HCP3S3_B5 TaxID=3438871 RepID=UPI003F88F6DA
MADKVKVTLVKSPIGAVPKNKKVVEALGLHKVGQSNELPNTAATLGAVRKVAHLVKVEKI